MNQQRRVEIFSAGCLVCEDAVALVQRLACDSCEVVVLDDLPLVLVPSF